MVRQKVKAEQRERLLGSQAPHPLRLGWCAKRRQAAWMGNCLLWGRHTQRKGILVLGYVDSILRAGIGTGPARGWGRGRGLLARGMAPNPGSRHFSVVRQVLEGMGECTRILPPRKGEAPQRGTACYQESKACSPLLRWDVLTLGWAPGLTPGLSGPGLAQRGYFLNPPRQT